MTLGLWTRKAAEEFRWSLMGNISKSVRNSSFESDVNYGTLLKSFQRGRMLATNVQNMFLPF